MCKSILPGLTYPLKPELQYEGTLDFKLPNHLLPTIAREETRGLFYTVDTIELTLSNKKETHTDLRVAAEITIE